MIHALFAVVLTFQGGAIDLADLDKSVSPCDDFYRFANGGWEQRTERPPEYSSWNAFTEVRERNLALLKEIMTEIEDDDRVQTGSNRQKLKDLWCTCMDTERIEGQGKEPLYGYFERIDRIETAADLRQEIGRLHREGFNPLFNMFVEQDSKDATRYLIWAYQGGLGLPERDYYFRDDERSDDIRQKYLVHVGRMLELAGFDPGEASVVMDIETRLADASMTRTEQRDPNAIYNLMTVDEAGELVRNWNWHQFLSSIGAKRVTEMNVSQPDFFRRVDELLEDVSLRDWRTYLRWNVVSDLASQLPAAFDEENFDFYSRTLRGTEEQQPRWKRCLTVVDRSLGEALGQEYVKRAFSPEAKRKALDMVNNIKEVFRERLLKREWMSEETKQLALGKLDSFVTKIGYPDEWRDYSSLHLDHDASYAENRRRVNIFNTQRELAKIGGPIDRGEWFMSPSTVNAYYNPPMNEIVFPAGIMQPPYFSEHYDDAVNYGAMGAVIGHEITHGFDDEGSKFDAWGNLSEWWPEADRAEFERRVDVVREQYDEFTVNDGLHVNGKLTLGENTADFGGLTIAYWGLKKQLENEPVGEIDGFTQEQRVFLSWARAWRNITTPEALELLVKTNPHSPGRFRAIGPLQNMPEFQEAFGCSSDDPMLRAEADRAVIW